MAPDISPVEILKRLSALVLFVAFSVPVAAAELTQIVLQWDEARFSVAEIHQIEDELERGAASLFEVDGHDIGSRTVNIFIYSRTPDKAVERLLSILKRSNRIEGLRAAVAVDYNADRTDWRLKPVYPPDLKKFSLTE